MSYATLHSVYYMEMDIFEHLLASLDKVAVNVLVNVLKQMLLLVNRNISTFRNKFCFVIRIIVKRMQFSALLDISCRDNFVVLLFDYVN